MVITRRQRLSWTFALGLLAACGGEAELAGGAKESRRGDARNADALAFGGFGPGEDSTEGDIETPDQPPPADDPDQDDGNAGETPDPPQDDGRAKLVREMTFPAYRQLEGTMRQNLDAATLAEEVALRATEVERSLQQTQAGRPAAIDEHVQGRGENEVSEEFQGVASRVLDVLLVLDNSCYMKEEARNMAAKLRPLLDKVAETDWQIGVVTTDPSQSCLRALIKKGDTDFEGAFTKAVSVGTSGSSNPRGVLQAVRSLAGECLATPWIRPASSVEVLIVSDQDNCVDGRYCPNKDYAKGKYLTDYLSTIRTVGKNAHVHGVFMPPNTAQCDCPTATRPGNIYHALVKDTGGAWGSICKEDYKPALDAISANVEVALRRSFTLASEPAAGTLKVFVDGTELSSGFTLAGRVLSLATPLAQGAKLKVVYRQRLGTLATRFPLRYAPVAGSVQVQVNGVAQAPATYTVDQAGPAVVFQQAPAEASRITIAYTRDVPLRTKFELGAMVKAGSLRVTVDGMATSAYDVDEALGTVTFQAPPAEGAVIGFTWRSEGEPVLSYPVAIMADPSAVTITDKATGQAVAARYENGAVIIEPGAYAPGRRLLVTYPNPARSKLEMTLAQDPVPGSVVARAGGVTCAAAPELVVTGRTVSLDGCPFPASATEVVVDYLYWFAIHEFTFDVPNLPAPTDYQAWTVWVNDVETMDYRRTRNVFRFDQPLPFGATVKIRLEQYETTMPRS